jgi:K+/H+ antiporter YhaU regulatory subunit KhtT
VELYELLIDTRWAGRRLGTLTSASVGSAVVVALTRAGRAELPGADQVFQNGDILTVSATLTGIQALRARLQSGPEA